MMVWTVRRKILGSSAAVLLVIASASFYTGLASSELARSVVVLFRNNLMVEDLHKALDQTEAGLTGYLTNKSSDSLKDYIRYSTQLSEQTRKLNRQVRADESMLLQKDLAGLVDSYLEDAEAAVTAKRGRDIKGYSERYESSEMSAGLARLLITRIQSIFISDSLTAFSAFNSRVSSVLASNAALVLAATLMALMVLERFTFKLTWPLSKLAEAARAVGRGDYHHELPLSVSHDEIGTTAAAFSRMQESIREAFGELKSKSEVEKRLMEERVRVLDMDKQLKAAELLALQTQINPHFLFNTLSAGIQLAVSEEAGRTEDFLENLAAFIRYALKPPSRLVRVADEIECVQRYIWLLRLRFGDRFQFEVNADEAVLSSETPALVLQPLVENAVGHGLKNREEGGVVRVDARLLAGEAVLSVADSGDGMSEEEIRRVLGPEDHEVHEGGIGLRNVIRRVTLATSGQGRVAIEGSAGQGTTIRIFLPARGA